ncbi:type II toxin-antitoxin system RelE/ParE family toxin [Pedobacter glucosidilyticus]|uniref:type II toxin-antitoxin system RelE/ParE family toxin n=1 Tax=Pedobacter glucosidilyticus TaxID=1122941 RepID=UPI000414F2DA|nr:type II toxin-antitoxin system RelE/ParE family toxin [Pedobacter glucosidilyticus]
MKFEIRWSDEAEVTFDAIYQFVSIQWNIKQAEKLRVQTLKVLEQIAVNPYLFKESEIKNVRKAFISKHTSLFYETSQQTILLVFFWDNRQNPIVSF